MMQRIGLLLLVFGVLAACGEAQTATVAPIEAVAQANPTPSVTLVPTVDAITTPQPTRTPAPQPSPLPIQTVAPAVTASTTELDTPSLNEQNAPPTPDAAAISDTVAQASEPVRLVIGAIDVDAEPISVGLDEKNIPIVPKHDVGWYNLSAQPGAGENIVFWGHVLRWKDSPNIPAPFARLQEAGVGSPITVYTADGVAHEYVVTEQVWATPDQVQYILPIGSERVTLVSCIGDKVVRDGSVELSHRLITIAEPAN